MIRDLLRNKCSKSNSWIIEVSIRDYEKTGFAGMPNLTYICTIPPVKRYEICSNPDNVYSTGDKRRDRIISRFLVSDQDVDVCRLPDNSCGGDSDFSVISDDDTLTRLSHQGPVDGGLVGIVCSKAMFGMDAIDADKGLIQKHFARLLLRCFPDQGE